jgi:hypothetical protein
MKTLIENDYLEASKIIGCDVETIKAVKSVESGKGGFLPSGLPVILFEAHIFSRLTGHKYDKTNPDISSFIWNTKLYVGGSYEHKRLDKACKLNREAGLQSASWGLFQIMGFNYKACGFKTLQEFINAMYKSEGEHLKAFCNYIKTKGMATYLINKQWAKFAYYYNGAGYLLNRYDTKLKQAYEKLINNKK